MNAHSFFRKCPLFTQEIERVLYSVLYLLLLTRGKTGVGYDRTCENVKAMAVVGWGVSVTLGNYDHLMDTYKEVVSPSIMRLSM